MKRKAWYYRLPGSFYAFGPAMYDSPVSEREVRMMLLRTWYPNKKRLPAGVEVWSALWITFTIVRSNRSKDATVAADVLVREGKPIRITNDYGDSVTIVKADGGYRLDEIWDKEIEERERDIIYPLAIDAICAAQDLLL